VVIYHINSDPYSSQNSTEVRTDVEFGESANNKNFLESIRINPFNINSLIYGSITPRSTALDILKSSSDVSESKEYTLRYEFSSTFGYRFIYNFKSLFPGRWHIIWCLVGVLIISSIMIYLFYQTFKKKTEFLKINRKAAENLSDESISEEEEEEEEKSETKAKNQVKDEKNLEKIDEQEESEFDEEESIDFSQITNKPDQPLGELTGSQFDNNSVYEHVRSHNDKNSRKIFHAKSVKKKKKKNGIELFPLNEKENLKRKKKKRKKPRKPKVNKQEIESEKEEKPKKRKKKEKKFKFLIKRTEMKVFIILNFALFCLFSFSTETLILAFHNIKYMILENGEFDFTILRTKFSFTSQIVLFSVSIIIFLLVLLLIKFVFGLFHKMFRSHWKSKPFYKVSKFFFSIDFSL
jgi:hypothetical protein